MQLILKDNLPFITIAVSYRGMSIDIPGVLVDTGSASTILAVDSVAEIQMTPEPDDILYTIRGVGGSEVVFSRRIDHLKIGEHALPDFEVEIGGMDYGFEINGIVGMDFLTRAGAVIDLRRLELNFVD